ncbi:MAG TPA: HhH-GPD-type base excision DNA repair protein [Acidimicrobiales bacterium]|nr:HhH-GPD-type base excision DNA repair protein [Acidimicrobiales bacterium]
MPTPTPSLALSGDAAADQLLSREPLALLVGMVLDQQVPLEWAFHGPLELKSRLGGRLDAADMAEMDPDELRALFAKPPALHRFPGSMAGRVHELCKVLVEEYGGEADAVWRGAQSGTELLKRVKALPGFGDQKARIFVALLGKQLGVRPPGWEEAAGDYGRAGTFMSVADITSTETLAKVRTYKQARKAEARAASGSGS